jgi:hypothetical protein
MPMAFRSGQNYFKSISNIQTSYKHVITQYNVENIKINFKLEKIKRKFKAYTLKMQNTFQTSGSKDIYEN